MFEIIRKLKTPNLPNMQNDYLKKIFKLEEFIIDNISETNKEIIVQCHSNKRGMRYEGQYSSAISTTRIKIARHMIVDDRVVILHITQRRFYFSKYDKRVWEVLPDFKRKKHDSNIFRKQTLNELRTTNYTGTSTRRHTSKMYPLRLLDEIDGFKINWDYDCTRLGLDGKGIGKHNEVGNITNLDKHEVISVLPAYNQEVLEKWCQKLTYEQRRQIKEICVDMSNVPIAIIKKYFPWAHIVIDHFHIIQLAIKAMNQMRLIIQQVDRKRIPIKHEIAKSIHKLTSEEYKKIKPYLDEYLELKCFWKIIHQLRKVYWQKDYMKARSQLRYVIWLLEQNGISEMEDLAKTLRNWFNEILNYHISKTTNAYTEGVHTRFELIKRHHFGIRNLERFSKRILFCLTPLVLFGELLSNFVK